MQTLSKEQLTTRFQALSETLQNAIFSEGTADAIGKACQLRDVGEDSLSMVAALTGRVLLGYLRPESFAFEIQKETGIDALKATQVAHDIDAEIFSEVRLELKKLYPPTIQTPTVQAQGFAPRESGTGFQDSRFKIQEQKPAPRYVVPIPERFKKPESRTEAGIRKQELGMEQKAIAPKAQDVIPDSQFMIHDSRAPIQEKQVPPPSPAKISTENLGGQATPPQNIPPNESISYKLKASEGPPMDPIVPLPTFIQSKFKTDELGMAGQESGIRKQELGMEQKAIAPKAQDVIPDSQFMIHDSRAPIQEKAPSTQDALKNAFGKFTAPSTATGITKEPVSPYRETIEEPTKTPEQKPAAKIQGKVIDLSKF